MLNFLVLLVAVLALDGGVSDFNQKLSQELTKISILDFEPLRNPVNGETSKKLNYIADPFFPIVVLAYSLYKERDFTFYLSRYDLHHQNRFHLLI